MKQMESASLYTDFNGLAELRRGAKENSPDAIKVVAQQFEAIFVQMMLKSMRDATLADGLFESDQMDQYVDLYDKQLANTLSSQGRGIGLADTIARQLGSVAQPGAEDWNAATTNIPTRLSTQFKLIDVKEVDKFAAGQKGSMVDMDSPRHIHADRENAHISAVASKSSEPVMNTPDDFVTHLWPMAEKAAAALGVEPKAILAQAALETGWGRAVIRNNDGRSSFNLFNIKSSSDWNGDSVVKSSLEFNDGVARQEKSAFRSYTSYAESFTDYVNFIKSNSRYENALKEGKSASNYLRELQQAGYATDPRYAEKIESIMNRVQFISSINTFTSGYL